MAHTDQQLVIRALYDNDDTVLDAVKLSRSSGLTDWTFGPNSNSQPASESTSSTARARYIRDRFISSPCCKSIPAVLTSQETVDTFAERPSH